MNLPKGQTPPARSRTRLFQALFAFLFGGFLGLLLLKFGNPPIFEHFVSPPEDIYQFIFASPWPISWAYAMLGALLVGGLFVARWRLNAPPWLLALPLAWLAWQWISGAMSLDAQLTRLTLRHFAVCVACFYLACLALGRARSLSAFWFGLFCGFIGVLVSGWGQHFGGLEETRRYFYLYVYPQLTDIPPEYIRKMSSNRIFATLFYPNALAGAILLFLPVTLTLIAEARERFTAGARWFLGGAVLLAALACLYWSGSKGGWLLMLLLGLIAFLRLPVSKALKIGIAAGILVIGLSGFFYKYSGFFSKGATSVVARFDYWRAGAQIAAKNPLFGTGPGTFSVSYKVIKSPQAEMSRLTHNDYLQQACDSGLPGFAFYTLFISAALWLAWRRLPRVASGHPLPPGPHTSWLPFAIWLGVLGWALQSFLEFGLYLPSLAWPAFAFLGLLVGRPPEMFVSPPDAGADPEGRS